VRVLEDVYKAGTHSKRRFSVLRRGVELMRRRRINTLPGSRDNIHHHYDIGNKFYALWLGKTMAYTCAYYPTPGAALDEAQVAKMDHVCRKMRLRPGESVVEAGCGWGSLAIHMAQNYGVKVRAFNISREQVAFARERAQREGLASSVEFVEDDYRNITGKYDAFVSVGMLEHVGVENYPGLGRVIQQCLGNVGRGLIHSIGRNRPAPMHPWIEKRIFPGAYPPSLGEMMQIFEPWNLSILDVENIRFGERLRVTINAVPDTLPAKVPGLLLQPLVENAVKHGISRLTAGGEVNIDIALDQNTLHIRINNDGPDVNQAISEADSMTGLGLRVTRERLQALYGKDQSLHIQARPEGGAEVAIRIPFRV